MSTERPGGYWEGRTLQEVLEEVNTALCELLEVMPSEQAVSDPGRWQRWCSVVDLTACALSTEEKCIVCGADHRPLSVEPAGTVPFTGELVINGKRPPREGGAWAGADEISPGVRIQGTFTAEHGEQSG